MKSGLKVSHSKVPSSDQIIMERIVHCTLVLYILIALRHCMDYSRGVGGGKQEGPECGTGRRV